MPQEGPPVRSLCHSQHFPSALATPALHSAPGVMVPCACSSPRLGNLPFGCFLCFLNLFPSEALAHFLTLTSEKLNPRR